MSCVRRRVARWPASGGKSVSHAGRDSGYAAIVRATTVPRRIATFVRHGINALFNGQ
jgi:hypothetical protein